MLKELNNFLLGPLRRQIGIRRLRKAASRPPVKIVIGASGFFEAGWTPTEADYMNLLRPAGKRFYLSFAALRST